MCMVDEFDIPAEIIDRKVTKMKMISPSNREVDVGKTLSETEYIGMCRREVRSIIHTSIGACAELLSPVFVLSLLLWIRLLRAPSAEVLVRKTGVV